MQMFRFTNILQVYQLTGSEAQLGLTGLFQALPLFALGFFSGAIADRFDRRKLLMATQVVSLATALVLGFLSITGRVEVWHIWGITVLHSVVNAFGQPARLALVPSLVPKTHLMNAVTLNISIGQSSQILGPALAGFLFGTQSPAHAYFVNMALIVPAVVTLTLIRPRISEEGGGARRPLTKKELLEGIQWFFSTKVILGLLLFDAVLNLFGNWRLILPAVGDKVLGVDAVAVGQMATLPAYGAIAATLTILALGNVRHKGWLAIISTVMYGVGMLLFGLSHWFFLSLGFLFMLGFFDSLSMSVRHTTLQVLVPDRLRGRASSVMQVFTGGMPALGAMVIGFIAEYAGPGSAFVIGSFVVLGVAAFLTIAWKEVRQFVS